MDAVLRVSPFILFKSQERGQLLFVEPSFHKVWEFWAYNIIFGLFQAPYYAFSQTMMAELTPPGFDNMVRELFLL